MFSLDAMSSNSAASERRAIKRICSEYKRNHAKGPKQPKKAIPYYTYEHGASDNADCAHILAIYVLHISCVGSCLLKFLYSFAKNKICTNRMRCCL